MAQLSDMIERVQDEFPAAPELVALRALSDSTKEFCKRTHYWQDLLPALRTRPDVTEFELSPDTGTVVVALKEVRDADGRRIEPYAGELKRLLVTPLPTASKALGYVQRTPTSIDLLNATTDVQQLTVKAAITLASGATDIEIPDDLVDEYAEALAAGAKARLVRMAGQPWYAPEAAAGYAVPFYAAVNEAKARALTSLGETDLRIEFRSW